MNYSPPFHHVRQLQRDICDQMGLDWEMVFSETKNWSKKDKCVNARWLYMWIRYRAGVSLSQIGRELNMDHTSVKYGVDTVKASGKMYSEFEGIRFGIKALRDESSEFTVGSFIVGL